MPSNGHEVNFVFLDNLNLMMEALHPPKRCFVMSVTPQYLEIHQQYSDVKSGIHDNKSSQQQNLAM
jgi:hypothetical protein